MSTNLPHSSTKMFRESNERARSTRPTSESSSGLRRVLSALVRPRALGIAHLARLLAWHRPRRRGDAPPGLRPPVHAVRRPRLACDLLHDRDGALADERDQHRVGTDAVARG